MSAPTSNRYLLEINEFSGMLAHVVTRGHRITVEDLVELKREEMAAEVTRRLGLPNGAGQASLFCLIRPRDRVYHLASEDESRLHTTAESIRRHLLEGRFSSIRQGPIALAAAGEGPLGAPGRAGHWIAAGAPVDAIGEVRAVIDRLPVAPESIRPASFSFLSAGRRLLKVTGQSGTIAVLDLGSRFSGVFLLGSDGIQCATTAPVGVDLLVQAIEAEENLRVPGAASRLLFNPRFDFTPTAGRIARHFVPALSEAIATLAAPTGRTPVAFVCTGLPRAQAWFGEALAGALGIETWRPDLRLWFQRTGVLASAGLCKDPLEVEWLGLVGSADPSGPESRSASHSWFSLADGSAATDAAGTAESSPRKTEDHGSQAMRAVSPARGDRCRGARHRTLPGFPRPLSRGSSLIAAAVEGADQGPGAHHAAAMEAIADSQQLLNTLEETEPRQPATGEFPSSRRLLSRLAMAVGIVIFGILGILYFSLVAKQKAAARQELVHMAERAAAEAEARIRAEHRASEEAAARQAAEDRAARQIAEAQAARLKAEELALSREAETQRMLSARGSLSIVTEPPGASVTIGQFATGTSPVRMEGLPLGRFPATVRLDGFEPLAFEIEIRENETTDPGLLTLRPQTGSLSIETGPVDVPFVLRPMSTGSLAAAARSRQGVTPAKLDDLPTGDYTLTLAREGWPRHTQSVTIKPGETTSFRHDYAGAVLRVSSEPAGATVRLNGSPAGVTPLVLSGLPPGEIQCGIELDGYIPVEITRHAAAESPIDLQVTLEPSERVHRLSELDVPPRTVHAVQPEIGRTPQRTGTKVVISLEIGRDGAPLRLAVEETPDEEAGQLCLEAVAKWRFSPGLVAGRPVRCRVSLSFAIR